MNDSAAPMLDVRLLTKQYGNRTALDKLSLTLPAGCLAVLLGPNGAGNSTLFQVLTGLFAADAGEVRVAGLDLRHRTARALAHIGVVFQQMALDLDLSVERNLRFHADLHGLPRAQAAQRIESGCVAAGLRDDLARPVRELSGGNRRKVELVRALLHRPALLLMDEPTVGLDPSRGATCAPPWWPMCGRAAPRCYGPRTWCRKPKTPIGSSCCTRGGCWPPGCQRKSQHRWAESTWKKLSSAQPPDRDERQKMLTQPHGSASILVALMLAGSAAVATAQGVAFVSSEKDHAISVVDLKAQALLGSVATCKRPRHMQLSVDGKQLWVACSESNQADMIDVATRKSARRISLGEDPEVFDLSIDGKTLYVSQEDDATLIFVDAANGKTLKSIEVGKEPEGVKTSVDGKTVNVTSEVANMVHVVDVASATLLKNIKVGKRPRRFAMTPDGKQLWVTNELDASVSIIDTGSRAVVCTLQFEIKGARAADITPVGIVMSRDGTRAFVGLGRANHVAFVDVAQRKVTHTVLVGKRAWGLALDHAEKTLLVVNGLSDDLSFVDVAQAKATKTIKVGRVPHSVVIVE
jgi:PQQ-dependent catabolism-associated beta-propeller protein